MTIIICTVFYIYSIYSINSYRKEIICRVNDGYSTKHKVKAPYPFRVSVLLSLVAFATNLFLFLVAGDEETILINALPVLFFVNVLWRYQRRIKKMDKENV